MTSKQIGSIFIAFGSLNTALTLFRLYKYFFTGHDISPLHGDAAFGITLAMLVVSLISYVVGFELKGKI